jgi:prevent-host-death family protein
MKHTTTVGAFDAKTRLSELLDQVEAGQVVIITRHGEPIAKLSPYDAEHDRKSAARGVDGLLALRAEFLRSGVGLTPAEIKAAISDGRS